MSFSFFTWLHNEVVALRAAVARLESHTGAPESKPADKPVDAVPPVVEPVQPAPQPAPQPTTGTDNWLTREMAAQAGPQTPPAPVAPADPDWYDGMPYKTGRIVCPFWWWSGGGFVRAQDNCEIHFVCDPGYTANRDLMVNQGSIPQAPSVTVESSAGTVTKDLGAPAAQHCGIVAPIDGEIVVKLTQSGGCVVMLGMT